MAYVRLPYVRTWDMPVSIRFASYPNSPLVSRNNRFEDLQCSGSSVCFAFLKVLLFLPHCIGDMSKAENLDASDTRERIEGSGFHFDCKRAFRASRFNRLSGLAKWSISRPARTNDGFQTCSIQRRRYILTSSISEAFAYSVGFTALTLIVFGGIKGHFTGINKAKSAGQTLLVGGLAAAAAYALAHTFGS
jgi:hypothetical protein